MVQLQLANGVINTKSTVGKLEDKWETVNDLIEPMRRLTNMVLTFDPVYGQCLQGLLGLATCELTYYQQDRAPAKAYEVERMKFYIEIIRTRFGGKQLTPSYKMKFFQYDSAIMEDAKHMIYEQRTKEQRKEGEKAEVDDDSQKQPKVKVSKNYCAKFNSEAGCDVAKCPQVHRCINCSEQGHARKNCTETREKKN